MVRRSVCAYCGAAEMPNSLRPDCWKSDAVAVRTSRDVEGCGDFEAVSELGCDEVRVPESKSGRLVSLNTMPPHLSDER